jgi:hypothetical protein
VTNIVEATYQFLVQRFHISDCFLAAFFFQMSATTKKTLIMSYMSLLPHRLH